MHIINLFGAALEVASWKQRIAKMRAQALFGARTLAFVASFYSSQLSAQPITNPQQAWGPANDGLRMALSAVKSDGTTHHDIELYVAFENVGSIDVVLDLGFMVGNGKMQYPVAVQLMLTDSKGQTKALHYSAEKLVIMGRVDEFLVPLPAGAVYVLRVNLAQYCCFEPGNYDSKLPAGQYQIVGLFKVSEANFDRRYPPCFPLMNCWKGALQSNSIDYEVSRQPL